MTKHCLHVGIAVFEQQTRSDREGVLPAEVIAYIAIGQASTFGNDRVVLFAKEMSGRY